MDKLNQIMQAGVTTPYSKRPGPPNRTGIAAPLSPMDIEKIKRQQYSPDPVIANLQKLGRGVKDFVVPDTPMEALGFLGAPAKAAATVGSGLLKSAPGKKQYLFTPDIPKSQELDFITSTQAAIKSPEDLYNTSTKLNPRFQAEVKSIADNLGLEKAPKFKMSGGKTIDVEVKSLESIQDKALRKQGNVQEITDGMRTRIYVNKPADSDKVVAQLNKKYDVIIDRGLIHNLFHLKDRRHKYFEMIANITHDESYILLKVLSPYEARFNPSTHTGPYRFSEKQLMNFYSGFGFECIELKDTLFYTNLQPHLRGYFSIYKKPTK